MKQYECKPCGYIYDEAAGDPDNGIAPGTKWEDLPADWVCPCAVQARKSLRLCNVKRGRAHMSASSFCFL